MGAESSNNIFVALRDSGANTEDERSHMTEVSQLVGSLNNTFSQSEQRVETIFPHDRGQSSTQLTRPVTQQVDTYDNTQLIELTTFSVCQSQYAF